MRGTGGGGGRNHKLATRTGQDCPDFDWVYQGNTCGVETSNRSPALPIVGSIWLRKPSMLESGLGTFCLI